MRTRVYAIFHTATGALPGLAIGLHFRCIHSLYLCLLAIIVLSPMWITPKTIIPADNLAAIYKEVSNEVSISQYDRQIP
jgi:uncharacterized membrane protein (Fun14 family)